MKGRCLIPLVVSAFGLALTGLAGTDSIFSPVLTGLLDTRDTRPTNIRTLVISSVEDDLLPMVYNSLATDAETVWPSGGDAAKAATIRVTRMDACGEPDNPLVWVPHPGKTDWTGSAGEGFYEWVPESQGFYRVELKNDDGEILATAFLDLSDTGDLDPIFERIEDDPTCDAALDTSTLSYSYENDVLVPRRVANSFNDLLSIVYQIDWFEGAEIAVDEFDQITIVPVDGETAGTTLAVTNGWQGTAEWPPMEAKVYRTTLKGQGNDGSLVACLVDIDLSGWVDDDIELSGLLDDAGDSGTIHVKRIWLEENGITEEQLRDTTTSLTNGLPAWQSFILGLNPTGDVVALRANIAPLDLEQFRIWGDPISGAVLTNYVNVVYRLVSTDELGTTFETDGEDAGEPEFTVEKDGVKRFFRIRSLFFWKK